MKELQEWLESVGQKYTLEVLEELHWLNLPNKNLTFIHENIGDLKYLRNLYIEENKLTSLPESIGKLKHLRYFRFYGNKITLLQSQYDFIKTIDNAYGLEECKIIPDTQLARDLFL